MSIFPYIYYMIASFHITDDNRQIAIYAGMVTSAFAFAEFSTGVVWGRLSDRVGRKPILMTGLAGTGLSMLIFGFAPSLPMALLGRALGGLLNGYGTACGVLLLRRRLTLCAFDSNIGVLQTTVAEMITVKEHQRMLLLTPGELPTESLLKFDSPRLCNHAICLVPGVCYLTTLCIPSITL